MRAVCKITVNRRSVRLVGPPDVARAMRRADLSAILVEIRMTGERVSVSGGCSMDETRAGWALQGVHEKELVDWLMSLPGFDIDELVRAMQFRGNATFELWKAPAQDGLLP